VIAAANEDVEVPCRGLLDRWQRKEYKQDVHRRAVRPVMTLLAILLAGALGTAPSARADPAVGDVVPCPTLGGIIPEGSTCKVELGNTLALVSPGPVLPPCERAQPPPEARPETCVILKTLEDPLGTSALLSFTTQQGDDFWIWILPGGKQFLFPPATDDSA
jgi:hypothetical protein